MQQNGCMQISMHFYCNLLQICDKFELLIFQGRAATYLRCDGQVLHDFVANFICFPAVKEFGKMVKFDKVIVDYKVETFFATRCRREITAEL